MVADPRRVTEFGIPGKWNTVFTGAEVVTLTNTTIREGLGQEPAAVLMAVQATEVPMTPAELSQAQVELAVACRLVTFGASSLAA
jgi:uncharacterized membrane protein